MFAMTRDGIVHPDGGMRGPSRTVYERYRQRFYKRRAKSRVFYEQWLISRILSAAKGFKQQGSWFVENVTNSQRISIYCQARALNKQ